MSKSSCLFLICQKGSERSQVVKRLLYSTRAPGGFQQSILHEDNHLLVVSKPSGVLTQGDSTGDTSLLDEARAYLERRKPGKAYVGLVHRLDRPTSGVVVFAKTSKAAARLSEAFRDKIVKKHYVCIVNGHVEQREGTLHDLLAVKNSNGKVKIVNGDHTNPGRVVDAHLRYIVLHQLTRPSGKNREQSLLHVELGTGRKHQIRSQLSSFGHPVVGDRKYMAPQGFPEKDIALHALMLCFPHPVQTSCHEKQRIVVCTAPVPPHWSNRYGDLATANILNLAKDLEKTYLVRFP